MNDKSYLRIHEQSVLVEEWRKHRKLINKSFKQGILDMFVDVFYEKSQILSKILKNGKYDNLTYLFEKFTLDVFCGNLLQNKNMNVNNNGEF